MHRSGQTFLEMVIAIGVIIAAVVGSMTLIVSTITAGRVTQSRVEAANFAREGIEIVRGIRDSNWIRRDQNVADIHPTDPNNRTTTKWDDTGRIDDGYIPLGDGTGIYVAVLKSTGWELKTDTADTRIYYDPRSITRYSRNVRPGRHALSRLHPFALSADDYDQIGTRTIKYLPIQIQVVPSPIWMLPQK